MSELLLRWRHAVQRSNVLHSLGNTSRHFRAVERPLSGRGSVDQSEATEHWHFPGLFHAMRFISSRNTMALRTRLPSTRYQCAPVQVCVLRHLFSSVEFYCVRTGYGVMGSSQFCLKPAERVNVKWQ